jgi:hypothetical protein
MKKYLAICFVLLTILSACNTDGNYVYWTVETENQIQRLDDAKVEYVLKEGEIWVREDDMYKVIACCT